MIALRRKAVESAGRLPLPAGRRTRPYSTAHPEKAGDHGHHHHHAGPKAESLGAQFFVALALVPISVGVYTASRPDAQGNSRGFSNLIGYYKELNEKYEARNSIHTAASEAAAFDRNLFHSAPGTKHVDLRFPEIFNTGSPFNVSAGQGPRNMDALVAHYEKKNADAEEAKVKALAAKEN
ncbi:NADH-ubiquinone oxidoreductase 17.8 kDa subunit [Diplocarpon rosae]|nr:NADH-ubiquinone oxidoreductase 17.8 kDa subunit [Diplocarpon rosae]